MKRTILGILISLPLISYSQQAVKQRAEIDVEKRIQSTPEQVAQPKTPQTNNSTKKSEVTNEAELTHHGNLSFSFVLPKSESLENARAIESRLLNERREIKSISVTENTCKVNLIDNLSEAQQQQVLNYVAAQFGYKSAKF